MKKLILSVTAIAGLAMAGNAQQVLLNDNGNNSYDTTIGGSANTSTDLNLELLVGATAGTVTTDVVTLLLNQATSTATTALGTVQSALGDVSHAGGTFTDLTFNGYAVPAGTDFYQVLAWTGSYQTYAAALASGATGVFAGESTVTPFSPAPAAQASPATLANITPFNLAQVPTSVVPEPSTLAMAGVGLASMLMFRRRNK
jgi:hypothetical protein